MPFGGLRPRRLRRRLPRRRPPAALRAAPPRSARGHPASQAILRTTLRSVLGSVSLRSTRGWTPRPRLASLADRFAVRAGCPRASLTLRWGAAGASPPATAAGAGAPAASAHSAPLRSAPFARRPSGRLRLPPSSASASRAASEQAGRLSRLPAQARRRSLRSLPRRAAPPPLRFAPLRAALAMLWLLGSRHADGHRSRRIRPAAQAYGDDPSHGFAGSGRPIGRRAWPPWSPRQ